jgi:hypothetical protein
MDAKLHLPVREEHRLKAFGNRVLRSIFRHKRVRNGKLEKIV